MVQHGEIIGTRYHGWTAEVVVSFKRFFCFDLFKNVIDIIGIGRMFFDGMGNDFCARRESSFTNFTSKLFVTRSFFAVRSAIFGLVNYDGIADGISRRLPVLVLQVPLAVGLCGEAVVAELALERLLAGVSAHVTCQSALVVTRVRARAHVTVVGSFTKVLLVVTLQSSQVWINC